LGHAWHHALTSAFSHIKLVVFSECQTHFLSYIASWYYRITFAALQVWSCSLGANFIVELQQAGTLACVDIPEPVRSQLSAVLNVFTRFHDAFAAIFIENCARGAAVLVKVAFARASRGIPVASSFTLYAITAIWVKLISGTGQWNFSCSGSVWAYTLA
jgi:hypothetical protein